MRAARAALAAAALLLPAAPAPGLAPPASRDWSAWAPLDTVRVVTRREDGSQRETTVWIVVWEGRAYLRTGRTRWGAEALRDPRVAVESRDERREARAVRVEDAATREAVVAAFGRKYGPGLGSLVNWIRGRDPLILRLDPP